MIKDFSAREMLRVLFFYVGLPLVLVVVIGTLVTNNQVEQDTTQVRQPTITTLKDGNQTIIVRSFFDDKKIRFPDGYDPKVWFCTGDAHAIDAEEIAWSDNTITFQGEGYCSFLIET